LFSLPMTAESVWRALQRKQQTSEEL